MSEHDIEKNGVISYLEFKYIFMDIQDQEAEKGRKWSFVNRKSKQFNLTNIKFYFLLTFFFNRF